MKLRAQLLVLATLAFSGAAFGQLASTQLTITSSTPTGTGVPASPYMVKYFANLLVGDGFINMTNDGSDDATVALKANNICVNVYAIDPAEELVACCACSLTPNALQSLSVKTDLISNPDIPAAPTTVTVALIASDNNGGSVANCDASLVGSGASKASQTLVTALHAWGTTIHSNPQGSYDTTETEFSFAVLSPAELNHLATTCGFIESNDSGYGICKSCATGGLGAVHE